MSAYGLLAEFDAAPALAAAARAARAAGYTALDAYAPHPVHELDEALGVPADGLPALVLGGGVLGALAGYGIQYYAAVLAYPLNVGGRPSHAWPAFVVVTFELAILSAALTAVIGMFALNGLPRPHHPLFASRRFERASRDRFFLCVEARDPLFDASGTRAFLEGLGPLAVEEIEA